MRLSIIATLCACAGFLFITGMGPVNAQYDCPIDGAYQSDWGPVTLEQQGSNVSGTWRNGTVSGVRSGNVIHYTWYQGVVPGGRGFWQISPDCNHLTGPWGNGDSETGGGNWNLHK